MCIQSLQFVVLVEVYYENLALQRYIVGEERILISFSDNMPRGPKKNIHCMLVRNDSENIFIITVKIVLTLGPPQRVLGTPEVPLYHALRTAEFQSIDMICGSCMLL